MRSPYFTCAGRQDRSCWCRLGVDELECVELVVVAEDPFAASEDYWDSLSQLSSAVSVRRVALTSEAVSLGSPA